MAGWSLSKPQKQKEQNVSEYPTWDHEQTNSKDQFPKWVIIIFSENWHKTWIWTFEKGDSFCFLNPHFSGFMLVYEFSGVPIKNQNNELQIWPHDASMGRKVKFTY